MPRIAQLKLSLVVAALFCVAAACLHFACLFWGAPLFRLLGAGEQVAQLAESGHPQPLFMAGLVGCVLCFFGYLCAALAGLAKDAAWMRYLVLVFALVLFMRALCFPFLRPFFEGNSDLFWWSSSAICFLLASTISFGLWQVWNKK